MKLSSLSIAASKKGYLLYDEVNDVLPTEIINSSDEIDELFSMFDSVGIEVVDSEEKYQSDSRGFSKGFEQDEQPEQEQEAEGENYAKTYDPCPHVLARDGNCPTLNKRRRN